MEAKEPTRSHCGVKTVMSHITGLRTWFPPCVLLLLCLSLPPAASVSPPLVSAVRNLSECPLLDLFFKKTGSKSLCPDYIQLIGPCFRWRLVERGWANWSWKGGLGWGQGKLSWPGAQRHTNWGEARRVRGLGQPQAAVRKVTFSLWKKEDWSFTFLCLPGTDTNCNMALLYDMKAGINKKPCRV